jgi:hypothetical protein
MHMRSFRFLGTSSKRYTIQFYILIAISIFPAKKIRRILLSYYVKLIDSLKIEDIKIYRKMYEVSFFYLNDYYLANRVSKMIFRSSLFQESKEMPVDVQYIVDPASYIGDMEFINKLTESKIFFEARSIQSYLNSLISFNNRDFNWSGTFHKTFLDIEKDSMSSGNILSYSDNLANFLDYPSIDLEFQKLISRYNFKIDSKEGSDLTIAVVSCDLEYFRIYGVEFISSFYKFNKLILKIVLVLDNGNFSINDQHIVQHLISKFDQLEFEYETATSNIAVISSLLRFKYALSLIQESKANVIILDIDFNPIINFGHYISPIFPNDISVAINNNCLLPWGVYSVGVSLFKCSMPTELFLVLFNHYVEAMLKNNLRWTVDQSTFAIVYHFLKINNYEININDISKLAFKLRSQINTTLTNRKVNAKKFNLNIV